MLTLATLINRPLTLIFDLIYAPLHYLGVFGSLAVFAAATGVLMLWTYKVISNQEAIRLHKKRIMGNLLGVRLFQHDLGVFFRIQWHILCSSLRYASQSLKPMGVMVIPMMLILIQLDGRYGTRPFEPGEAALLKVTLAAPTLLSEVSLESPESILVETRAIRIPSQREVVWRVSATQVGTHELTVKVNGLALTKHFVVGETQKIVPGVRASAFLGAVLSPGESPIVDGPVTSIEVLHPASEISLFGWRSHWLVPFFCLSIITGFALKGLFGVDL